MSLDTIWSEVGEILSQGWAKALLVAVAGYLIGRLAAGAVTGLVARRTKTTPPVLVSKIVRYAVFGLALVMSLEMLGVDVSVLLGAAGILTIALGFASQTSVSNVISGLFLVAERPFVIGDVIKVGQNIGFTHSIGFMSVTLRTFDNLYVRVPNEMIVKTDIINYSHFPVRRFDLDLRIGLDQDLEQVQELLQQLAHEHPLVLEEPQETFLFLQYSPSAYDFRFSVWAQQEDFAVVRNEIPRLVKETLEAHDIEIPIPKQRVEMPSGVPLSAPAPAPPVGSEVPPAPAGPPHEG